MPKVPPLSSNQAYYILEKLVDEKVVSAADIRRHLSGMWQEMSALERRIAELRELAEPIRHPVRAAKRAVRKVRKAAKKVTAEVQASRQLQGRYIAAIRQLPKNQREKYAAIAKEKGREAAIAAMKKR
ncbi:MAG: hypothetical protein ACXVH7_04560 [Thermoanaerobaculia bacterium]